MYTVLAARLGFGHVNGIKFLNRSMSRNSRPVMSKDDHGQEVSQQDVYHHTCRERDHRFDPGAGQFTEPRRKPDTQKTEGECPGP